MLGLLATAASPALAGTWEPAPAVQGGYQPLHGAYSVGKATEAPTAPDSDELSTPGPIIDGDGRTLLRFNWQAGSPFEVNPSSASGTFLYTFSGDVRDVSEQYGYASARLGLNPNNNYPAPLFVHTRRGGALMENTPVPVNPTPRGGTFSSASVQTTPGNPGQVFAEVDFNVSCYNEARASYSSYGVPYAYARAVSAAATIGVVDNSVSVTSP